MINLDFGFTKIFSENSKCDKVLKEKITNAYNTLLNASGKGNDFLGWLDSENIVSQSELEQIKSKAEFIRKNSEALVCIGIGGSYLGTKAILEALKPQFADNFNEYPQIIYSGNHISEDYMYELLKFLDNKDYSVCVISKSGTTTEPAIAFRIIKQHIENKYGLEKAAERIVAITDKSKGALKTLADKNKYTCFVVPDNIGGRFSVLSAVGLFPLAVAGLDIDMLLKGSIDIQENLSMQQNNTDRLLEDNIAAQYAYFRNYLYSKGVKIELLANYDPRLSMIGEWWKQLFGESEGKGGKGIFPASLSFTTDLHSLGQYIQDGERILCETVLSIAEPNTSISIPSDKEDLDGLNYIADKRISFVNSKAEEGTCNAHHNIGNVEIIRIILPKLNEYYIGQLVYFFEFSCGISAYCLGVNPFDQPGVEEYKSEMFRLLGKG